MITVRSRLAGATTAALLAGGGLAGCGSGSSISETGASSTTASSSDSAQTGQPAPGGDETQAEAIRACLEKAGISVPTPSGTPDSNGGPPPAGTPSGTPPTAPTGDPGDPGALLSDPKVVAALEDCGITVPTTPPGSGAGGAAGGTDPAPG